MPAIVLIVLNTTDPKDVMLGGLSIVTAICTHMRSAPGMIGIVC